MDRVERKSGQLVRSHGCQHFHSCRDVHRSLSDCGRILTPSSRDLHLAWRIPIQRPVVTTVSEYPNDGLATIALLAARYLLRGTVESKVGKWLGPFHEAFAKSAFSYLSTLRLVPLFPFFVVNLVPGLTRMNVRTAVATTAISMIPVHLPMRGVNWIRAFRRARSHLQTSSAPSCSWGCWRWYRLGMSGLQRHQCDEHLSD